jgi:cytochrome c
MARHKWESWGGLAENPGVYDNGNGGMVFVEQCAVCGAKRKRGEDYTRHRPGNTYSWRIISASTYAAPCAGAATREGGIKNHE